MNTDKLSQFSEYRLRGVIDRLENFRCSIGWGQLNADLEAAIDCMEYLVSQVKEDETETSIILGNSMKPHWIVTDHGFAGAYYECSVCGLGYWNSENYIIDHCPHCKVQMDVEDSAEGNEPMNEHDSNAS